MTNSATQSNTFSKLIFQAANKAKQLAIFLPVVFISNFAWSEVIFVTTTQPSGEGSFLEAINMAEASAEADIIEFSTDVANEIFTVTEPIVLSQPLEIRGPIGTLVHIENSVVDSPLISLPNWASNLTLNRLKLTSSRESTEEILNADFNFTGHSGDHTIHIINSEMINSDDRLSLNNHRAITVRSGLGFKHRVVIENSKFIGFNSETGSDGGAIHAHSIPLDIINSEFKNNQSDKSGGAIYFLSASTTLSIENSLFENNSARSDGGAVALFSGELDIKQSSFLDNTSRLEGGAIKCFGCKDIQFSASYFKQNASQQGGALSLISSSSLIMSSFFQSNISELNGGAIFSRSTNNINIQHTTFLNNSAGLLLKFPSGGAIYAEKSGLENATLTLTNVTMSKNSAVSRAGAVRLDNSNSASMYTLNLINSTLIENTSENEKAITLGKNAEANVVNSVVSLRRDRTGTNVIRGKVNAFNSFIDESENADITIIEGPLLSNEAPLLSKASTYGGPLIGYKKNVSLITLTPLANSPLIDAGLDDASIHNMEIPEFDQRGQAFSRKVGAHIDIGALEYLENIPPVQLRKVPTQIFRNDEIISLTLSDYFSDPEGESLAYEELDTLPSELALDMNGELSGRITGQIAEPINVLIQISDGDTSIQSTLQFLAERVAAPTPTPATTPTPESTPTSTPTPVTTPTPISTKTPTSTPAPVTTPTPVSTKTPASTPTPVTTPTPVSTKTPASTPIPVSTPTPEPNPAPSVVPSPKPSSSSPSASENSSGGGSTPLSLLLLFLFISLWSTSRTIIKSSKPT